VIASLIGVAAGVVLAVLMYGIMLLFVEQQASSIVDTNALLAAPARSPCRLTRAASARSASASRGVPHVQRPHAGFWTGGEGTHGAHVGISGPVLTVQQARAMLNSQHT